MSEVAIQTKALTTHEGYTVTPYAGNPRLQVVTLAAEVIAELTDTSKQWPVQALEYKPFNRFAIADNLDRICNYTLGSFLLATLKERETGAFLLQFEGGGESSEEQADFNIKLSTAISHLIGVPNFDAMYGKYYARFTVRNDDNSDSYLRQAHRRMELHNDGTYVDEQTDFVLMMKLVEKNIRGGDSLLLHLDDWAELGKFYRHPMARQDIQWGTPPSKNTAYKIHHPVFIKCDELDKPRMLFIDQFAEPQNMEEGLYLHALGESLEGDANCFNVPLPVGSMLVVQNHFWLHGRDKFLPHPELERELLRQRGHFSKKVGF